MNKGGRFAVNIMKIKCVVPCRDASGSPTLYPCEIECTQDEYDNGEHYEAAKDMASEERYENYIHAVVFDENDGPAWLFEKLFKDKQTQWVVDECPNVNGHYTIRIADGSPNGDIEQDPIATVYEQDDASYIVRCCNR